MTFWLLPLLLVAPVVSMEIYLDYLNYTCRNFSSTAIPNACAPHYGQVSIGSFSGGFMTLQLSVYNDYPALFFYAESSTDGIKCDYDTWEAVITFEGCYEPHLVHSFPTQTASC